MWVTIANGKIWRGELKNKAKDGTFYWVDTTIVPFMNEDGIPYQYMAIRSDITDRKKAEQELVMIAEELNKAHEIANSGSFESNFITEIDTWSENFYKIFEFNKEEVKPSFETFLSRVHPDDKHIAEEALATIEMERKMVEMEVRVIMPNGSVKWVSINVLPVFDGDNLIGLKGVMLDITERKHTQDQLLAVNNELEAFSYSVSHDLRTPLRAISGFAKILEEDYEQKFDTEGRKVLHTIMSNSKSMGQLIDDLLAFSRLGRKQITVTKINMNALVKSVREELSVEDVENKTEFNVSLLPPALADQSLIKQVWLNLISNAIKYSRHKSKTIIEIGANHKDGFVEYYVKDNGVGFDMQYYNKLFGVFQRLHSSEEFEGTGVGLAIVQKIIHRHNGTVWAESKPNEKTCFYFTLPNINA